MSERYGYVGNNPDNSPVIIARQIFQINAGIQTSFTFSAGYQIGYIDAYVNGNKKVEGIDYYATDGQSVSFNTGITATSVVELVAYKAFDVAYPNQIGDLSVGGNLFAITAQSVSAATSSLTVNGSALIKDNLTVEDQFTTTHLDVIGVTTVAGLNAAAVFANTGIVTGRFTAGIFSGPLEGIVTGGLVGLHTGDTIGNLTGSVNSSGVSTFSTLNVGTAGTVITTTSDGKVGIGSTQPRHSLTVAGSLQVKGFVETQQNVSLGGTILTLNAADGTAFTHELTNHIGIVSFTGIATSRAGAQTFTVFATQAGTPYNTTDATGIGMQKATIVTEGGVGFTTHIKVGTGSTIKLTNTAGALDILTFIVTYDGTTPIQNNSFKVVGFAATDFRGLVN